MAIFDRIRRARSSDGSDALAAPPAQEVPEHLLPEINQRVSVATAGEAPVPSRVEDRGRGALQLALPALQLGFGDAVTLTWEGEHSWLRLDTRVTGVDTRSAVPTILVATEGAFSRYDERRRDVRRAVELPIELRILRSRAVRAGRELQTWTTEVSSDAIRFETSAPFAPGDVVEVRIRTGDASDDTVGARLRVVRVDTQPGSWRSTCTAAFDEILRSDRARLLAVADSAGSIATEQLVPPPAAAPPTTLDGVGGRDAPNDLSSLQHVIDYLQHTDPARDDAGR